MAFDPVQFADLILRTLRDYDLYDQSAVALLLGTAAQESGFGTYLRQMNDGPARGVFQMERPTFDWLRGKYLRRFPELNHRAFEELEWDLRLAILLARLRYLSVSRDLPAADNLGALAAYWKAHYNTRSGRGTVTAFEANYRRYVSGSR